LFEYYFRNYEKSKKLWSSWSRRIFEILKRKKSIFGGKKTHGSHGRYGRRNILNGIK
jgi:hypothetical protein